MKTAVDKGATCWNGGMFYGPPDANSLQLVNAYFTKYPEDANKVVLSIKGPIGGDVNSVRQSVDKCLEVLDGKKTLDIYECARVDSKTPIEETIRTLARYVQEGKLGGISMDGTNPEPIRRAAAVHKIACVEVEFSLFALEITKNGVAKTCAELGIPIIAYSPLGRGFLTGRPQRADELPEGDVRKPFPRIQPGNFEKNLRLVHEVEKIAKTKGCSIGQIALAWVKHHSGKPGFPEIIPIPGATTSARVEENTNGVVLTEGEFSELNEAVEKFEVVGSRLPNALLEPVGLDSWLVLSTAMTSPVIMICQLAIDNHKTYLIRSLSTKSAVEATVLDVRVVPFIASSWMLKTIESCWRDKRVVLELPWSQQPKYPSAIGLHKSLT
nr:putative pyridoxal reductase 2 [Quercus suber]